MTRLGQKRTQVTGFGKSVPSKRVRPGQSAIRTLRRPQPFSDNTHFQSVRIRPIPARRWENTPLEIPIVRVWFAFFGFLAIFDTVKTNPISNRLARTKIPRSPTIEPPTHIHTATLHHQLAFAPRSKHSPPPHRFNLNYALQNILTNSPSRRSIIRQHG